MKNTNKTLWWLAGVIVIGVAGYLAFRSGWKFIKKDLAKNPQEKSVIKPLLQDELKRMITDASDSLYQLDFSGFLLNIDSGKGLIKNIKLTGDSNIYRRLVAQHKAPNMMMNMRADSMFIDHFEFVKTNDGKQLVVNNMVLQNPFIHIDYYPQPYNDTLNDSSGTLLASAVKKLMQLSVIRHMKMNNLTLQMVHHTGTSTKKTALRNLDIALEGMDVKTGNDDSATHSNSVIKIAGYRLTTADKLYSLQVKNMLFYFGRNSAFLEKTMIEPAYSKAAFFRKVSKANERYYFVYNNIQISGIDINRLLHWQQIKINKMEAESSVTDIYTDYELSKRKPPVRKNSFPHELLQRLAFDITIDTILTHNGKFSFELKAKKSDSTAVIEMDNIESKIINVTNNPLAKSRNHFTTVTTSGKVMKAANINTIFTFDLTDRNGAFSMKTEMSPMDGTILNPLMKPLAMVEIKSLDIQKMITTMHADEIAAKGNTDLYYRNMKIAMLKKDDERFKKRGFMSWVSNVATADDNPKKNGKFKKGPISIKRNPTDSFFGYLWRASLAGMMTHMSGAEKVDIDQPKAK
jgi:hypothetical protein